MTLRRDRYEVLATAGSGGEAQVVKALDRQHERLVALKIRPVRDDGARKDLLREAGVLLSLPPHPALPLVREDFFDGDDYVVVMDWVEGTDLAALLASRGRPGLAPSSVLGYLAQAAEALTHLHSQSPPVIHGDVKPGNLILTKGGRVKLVDFGLASAPNMARVRAGTPGYRAPELAAGEPPSRASDIYALAATAFALLSGAAPAGTLPAWDGLAPALAEQLEAALRRGLATDPGQRPKTPGELVERLRAGWTTALPTGAVTFCFSDIEGSTALWDEHPEAMAQALVRHDELIADAVEAAGGALIESMGEGDSTVSVFDSAPAAVRAALAANRALAAEGWPPGIRVVTRWGLHTGEAERRDGNYFGPTIILAARVRSQADGGEILLSSVTSELVASHLPEECSLVDLGPHRLKGIATPERIRALAGPGVRTPPAAGECPYRGLLAFEPGDRVLFFGREAVVAELVARVVPGALLAVVGASGSGKSSALRAGLVAAARAGEIAGLDDAVLLTPGAQARLDVRDEPRRLVVVDQFEELFTVCGDAERRERFIDRLLSLRCPVAIGVRADLYDRLGDHADLARAVASNQVLLGAMTDRELERAVVEPARLAGLRFETGLIELILRDVRAEPGALPLLSHALLATWERRDGRTLTVDGYRDTGGVASALARTADAVVDALAPEQRALARSVFLRLTELGEGTADSRRRAVVGDLVPEGVAPELVDDLLERLADARLVTLDQGHAEVAHEALIRAWPRLRGWLDEDRAGIRAHRQLTDAARLWDAGGREPSDLYRGTRLAGAVDLAQGGSGGLNATERAFLDASVAESERERRAERRVNRRLRGLLAAAGVLLLVAIAGATLSLVARDNARDAERAAEAQALTSDTGRVGALALDAPTLEQSLLFAVAGVELQDDVASRGNLLTVLQRDPAAVRRLQMSSSPVMAHAISPDSRTLVTGDLTGLLRFTDLRSWRVSPATTQLRRPVTTQAMAFAPDGRTVAVGTGAGRRSELQLVDVATRRARVIRAWPGFVVGARFPKMSLAFAPDGRHLAVALATFSETALVPVAQRFMLLDTRTGRVAWQRRYPVRPGQWEVHLVFTSSGDLVTSAAQGETIVWDTRTGRIQRRHPVGGRLAIAPDGRRVGLSLNSPDPGDPSAAVGLLDLRTGRHRRLSGDLDDEWIMSLAFSADGTRIIGAAFDSTDVWDVASGAIVERFRNEATNGASGGIALDRRGLAVVTPGAGGISAWDTEGTQRVGRAIEWAAKDKTCTWSPCAVVDDRGALMATSLGDGRVAVVDLPRRRLVTTLPARDGDLVEGLAFLPGGRRLATGGLAGTVTIWDLPEGKPVRTLRYSEPVRATAVSPDGSLLAVQRHAGEQDASHVEVRDLRSGAKLYTHAVPFGLDWPGTLAFSRDGRTLVSSGCCRRGSVVVGWEARSGAERLRVASTRHRASTLALSADSRTLAIGTESGKVLLHDMRSGKQRGGPMTVADSTLVQVAISPDGELLAASSLSQGPTLTDLASRRRVGDEFPLGRGIIPAVAFEPSGRLLITEFGRSLEWPLDRPALQRSACQIAGRDLSRAEWTDILPTRPYRRICSS